MHCLSWLGENTEWTLVENKYQIYAGHPTSELCGSRVWDVGLLFALTAPRG